MICAAMGSTLGEGVPMCGACDASVMGAFQGATYSFAIQDSAARHDEITRESTQDAGLSDACRKPAHHAMNSFSARKQTRAEQAGG